MAQKKTPAPIDRPLSRAYLRQFRGWSTAYPPGMSEPNSVRLMENVMVDRNGGMVVRPGLRHLTYTSAPDLRPLTRDNPGTGLGMPVVGGPEVFYTNDGERALLIAVKILGSGDRVEFRAIKFTDSEQCVYELTDPEIGFSIPSGMDNLAFSSECKHVEFLQIDNKIVALSNSDEGARLFFAGTAKVARAPRALSGPDWEAPSWVDSALRILHPNAGWILDDQTVNRNMLLNPSFEIGTAAWAFSGNCEPTLTTSDQYDGDRSLELRSRPLLINMLPAPLYDAPGRGWTNWQTGAGNAVLTTNGDWHVLTGTGGGPHLADSSRIIEGVRPDSKYHLGLDIDPASTGSVVVQATAFAADGSILGSRTLPQSDLFPTIGGRYQSLKLETPADTVTIRLSIGIEGEGWAGFKNLCLAPGDQSTDMFTGDSGAYYYWTGSPGSSASVHHPPQSVTIETEPVPFIAVEEFAASIALRAVAQDSEVTLSIKGLTKTGSETTLASSNSPIQTALDWSTYDVGALSALPYYVTAKLHATIGPLERDQVVRVDSAFMEQNQSATPSVPFFYGNSENSSDPVTFGDRSHTWEGEPNLSASIQRVWSNPYPALIGETPTANTLIATGGADANPYRMAFFFTFENDFGESQPSPLFETRVQRPRAQWLMELPDAGTGDPSGTETDDPFKACDQLAITLPYTYQQRAIEEGALRAHLYSLAWDDQNPVPVEAVWEDTIEFYADPIDARYPQPDRVAELFRVTPQRVASTRIRPLPAEGDINFSTPPRASSGLVAADRVILVGDPRNAATIRWSSGQPGDYLNLSDGIGGGQKTLSTGNLNIPLDVELWQNPQSVDTITVMCSDDNGLSRAYYMQPSTAQSAAGGAIYTMGFEETTNTPGSTSPYASEVVNNALYRPISTELVKSTASNYNINHRSMTDDIENMWFLLQSKQWIVSSQLNNRLYYLVHNPTGAVLDPYCTGNEVWVYDVAGKEGVWSRLLIQGNSLAPLRIGSRVFMSVGSSNGLYYIDPLYRQDDNCPGPEQPVVQSPIPWMFETNTQGANRAHDAWAHVQQVGIMLGDFTGTMEYGIRGKTSNGRLIDMFKQVTDNDTRPPPGQAWDIEDFLQIRRDMKEWFFYARSVDGEYSGGQVSLVQYRYTPVSVNVGYEYGSVETFEYGAPDSDYARNGIPLPYLDYNRP